MMRKGNFSPVFIVGCQRSGSTMLGAMLGAHPDVICLPEAQFIGELLPPDLTSSIDPNEFLDAIERHWRFRVWNFKLANARPRPGEVAPCFADTVSWLVRRYAAFVAKPHAQIWVDQQPGHVKLSWHLARHFPDARFLHIVRDGRAVALSLMERDWGPNRVLAAAKYWQERLALGLALEIELGPARVRRVQYEAILDRPREQVGLLAEFLGVRFHPAMEQPTGLRLPSFTLEDHRLIGGPLVRARADGWRRQLKRREVEIFEHQTGDLLPLLGYSLSCGIHPRPTGELEKLRLTLEDHVLRLVRRFRFLRRRYRHLSEPEVEAPPEPAWEQTP